MVCTPGSERPCYSGPSVTEGVGPCKAGTQVCLADGSGFGSCDGEVTPADETCGAPGDEDCDGETNEEGEGCVCLPDEMISCYTGPVGTEGVGICAPGVATCAADGTELGPCVGDIIPALEDCATPDDDDCDGNAPLCPGSHIWSKRFGDPLDQMSFSVSSDAAGNVYVTGQYFGSVDFGAGPLPSAGGGDVFVMKLDPAGNHLWSKRFGDGAAQIGTGVAIDPAGDVVVTGHFEGSIDFGGGPLTSAGATDVFVAKLDSSGNHLWSKRFGQVDNQTSSGVATDSTGNVFLTGALSGTADFGGGLLISAGGPDVFIVKLDPNGNHLWSKRAGSTSFQIATSITTDAMGNALVTGYFAQSIDFGGGPLPSAGGSDAFLVKLDSAGNHVFSKRFGDAGGQLGSSVVADPTGAVLLTGVFSGSVDFGSGPFFSAGGNDAFVVKLDEMGGHIWTRTFGDAADQGGAGVATDAAANVLLIGLTSGAIDLGGGPLPTSGDADIFVAKLDPGGNHLFSKSFPGAMIQSARSITSDPMGNVLVTGDLSGTIDLGGGAFTSDGQNDGFVAKFAP